MIVKRTDAAVSESTSCEEQLFPLILVVDDDDDTRDILSCGIASSGCRCIAVESGEDALELLKTKPVEIVVSDVQMQGMSGLDLCRRVKAGFDADVIIITGLVNNFAYEKIIAEGASDLIEKPIRLAEIVARLKRVLNERRTRNQLKDTARKLRCNLEKSQKAMEGFVQAISLTVEMRDPYTAGHQDRVAELATAIAEKMNLSEDRVYGLRMAAVIHDLGKITIPGEILCKPGKLSGPEYEMIKTHVRSGYDILRKIDFPWPLADIVIQHHERLDGSGYPCGLTAGDISPEARILAVADVFETIGSHRPYRPSLGIKKAFSELNENSGRLYDPEVVDVCLSLASQKDFKLKKPVTGGGVSVTTQMQSL